MAGARQALLARQRRAADRLRRDIDRIDGSYGHPYFRRFRRRVTRHEEAVPRADLVAAASLAGLVYVGDYHALPASQRFTAELLASLARRASRVVLGVEFVFTRQQRWLDRRQRGELDDAAFRRRIHYREEWGYPWSGFGELLDRARALGCAVHALDAPPRRGYPGLDRRDAHAAERIAAIVERDPEALVVVLFGETHLARSHLPRRVKSALRRRGMERRELVVFQNPDALHWRLVAERGAPPEAVRIDERTYAVFHTSPLEKYEAYRSTLQRWEAESPDDDEIDLTPSVHHLIEVLLDWLEIRPTRRRLRHRVGWSEDLVDAFPEVYSGREAGELMPAILREVGRSDAERTEARRRFVQRGVLYDSRANALFVERYRPGPVAGEAARFLRAALTGRLFLADDDFADAPADRAYGAAFTEALVQLASRLVDPTIDARDGAPEPATSEGGRGWLARHRRFEASSAFEPPESIRLALAGSRPLRRALARDLGRRLGRRLYRRVADGRLTPSALRALFSRPLEPRRAARTVLRLLRQADARAEPAVSRPR